MFNLSENEVSDNEVVVSENEQKLKNSITISYFEKDISVLIKSL